MKLSDNYGIYSIKNIINNKRYIGQSTNIYYRIGEHVKDLENNNHQNKFLQEEYNKYGADNFEVEILELCKLELLDIKEIEYINKYQSMANERGYNVRPGFLTKKSKNCNNYMSI